MKTHLYKITTLTNLHVGSGDTNFDIIDNQVQRDAITNLPNINSSSLKGAFREHFTQFNANGMINYIFGPDSSSNESHETGAYSFFEAKLLTRPVRSNVKYFFNATSPSVIKEFLQNCEIFNISLEKELKESLYSLTQLNPSISKPLIFEDIKETIILEDYQAEYKEFDTSKLVSFLGEDLALFEDKDLKALTLPVLARNKLEKGESKNLWYEEIVPKQTNFYFFIAKPENIDLADKANKIDGFERRFNSAEVIQIGANKSIGYGFCKVEQIKGDIK
ncbi:type III-B CRISPR module RAMP protein Cmr4 [Aliarcobacter cryaerophilus]|uniref:type III-B CRISPR module RAMP protein Cmr4 n=1 Tax=Aliarcobacter cryaerophilus TaxID=28198 RepID=UPI0021B59834|nr:type III-B CRISPR module RAMP protein Cmr4 [Aliarcobacter cryaerophilus]MCT7535971.1 type III-B CRISPR module RAMP protein Cmr4 [Aliarcobacter cryaerophilus]